MQEEPTQKEQRCVPHTLVGCAWRSWNRWKELEEESPLGDHANPGAAQAEVAMPSQSLPNVCACNLR
jgi:hypothetical protein